MTHIVHFTHSTTKAAGVMLAAAMVAFFIANSPIYPDFLHFWHADVTFGLGSSVHTMSLAHIVNDVLMAVFCLLVGLEIKYEMTAGALTDPRQALLPAAAAVGCLRPRVPRSLCRGEHAGIGIEPVRRCLLPLCHAPHHNDNLPGVSKRRKPWRHLPNRSH
jgi:hypothetical protein